MMTHDYQTQKSTAVANILVVLQMLPCFNLREKQLSIQKFHAYWTMLHLTGFIIICGKPEFTSHLRPALKASLSVTTSLTLANAFSHSTPNTPTVLWP